MSSNRNQRFVPQFEALENRCLLAASVTQVGGVITISGDAKANRIKITDNGGNLAGAITVEADGQIFTSTGAVTSIAFQMRGGNDRVAYNLGSLQAAVARSIDGVLGRGNDVFKAIISGDLGTSSSLSISAKGKFGRDALSVTATSMDIPAGAQATFLLNGAQDDDRVTVDWMGHIDGHLTSRPDGGRGRDVVRNNLTPLPGSTGTVNNNEVGGDDVNVVVHPLLGPITINPGDINLLDLGGLNLGDIGLEVLPDLTGILNDLTINPLDLGDLDLDDLLLGDLLDLPDLNVLDLDDLGVPLDQLGLGFIDLDDLAEGILTFNILDPGLVNLDTLVGGLLDTNGEALIEIDLSGVLGGVVADLLASVGVDLLDGQDSVNLRVLTLADLEIPNLGLGVFDLEALAEGELNIGVLSLDDLQDQLGISSLGLGILGNVL